MPEYLAPGVYVEEISTGPKPIEGVSTSNAAFIGQTERGPDYVKLITSWIEFQRWYGDYIYDRSYLPHAVQGFFDNGGKRCFVARVNGAGATHAFAEDALVISAIGRGAWGNNVRVRIGPSTQAELALANPAATPADPTVPTWVKVEIFYYKGAVPAVLSPATATYYEKFDDLTHEDKTNSFTKTVNAGSKLIRAWRAGPAAPLQPGTIPLAGGADAATILPIDFDGNVNPHRPQGATVQPQDDELGSGGGFAGLEAVDDISLILAPDEVRGPLKPLTQKVIGQCEKLKDRFAICSTELGKIDPNAVNPPQDTKYAAFYYPWIRVYDPLANLYRLLPPSGHIAGIFARTDIERGVHKAPANEVVRGATDLEFPISKEMQDILNPRGVNCIRDFRPDRRGIRLWGARTMTSDPEWKYVNVRRLFIFVEESIDEGTQWVVFEPNDEPTWARVRRSINSFLNRLWRNGALQGITADEAFFVKCDRTTMTQDDIDNGRLICYIGIAPVKPAEFVIFRIGQKTLEAQQA